jgi:hypothetical protein
VKKLNGALVLVVRFVVVVVAVVAVVVVVDVVADSVG